MRVSIFDHETGYRVAWIDTNHVHSGWVDAKTVSEALAHASQLLRGDDRAEDDWVRAQGEQGNTPCVTVFLTDGSSNTYKADDAQVHTGGALVLYMENGLQAIFASGTWRKVLSQ